MIHPTYAIDLFWHTHMMYPQHYHEDCMKWAGRPLVHIPWPEEFKQKNFQATASKWKEEFGVDISEDDRLGPWGEGDYYDN